MHRARTILSIEPYIMSNNDMFEIAESLKNYTRHTFFENLPEYCLRKDTGKINITKHYHQFSGDYKLTDEEDEDMYFFHAVPVDNILEHEISYDGMEGFFNDIDFRLLFNKIPKMRFSERFKMIPFNVHVVVDLEYVGKYEDTELFVQLIGYLDDSLKLVKI